MKWLNRWKNNLEHHLLQYIKAISCISIYFIHFAMETALYLSETMSSEPKHACMGWYCSSSDGPDMGLLGQNNEIRELDYPDFAPVRTSCPFHYIMFHLVWSEELVSQYAIRSGNGPKNTLERSQEFKVSGLWQPLMPISRRFSLWKLVHKQSRFLSLPGWHIAIASTRQTLKFKNHTQAKQEYSLHPGTCLLHLLASWFGLRPCPSSA